MNDRTTLTYEITLGAVALVTRCYVDGVEVSQTSTPCARPPRAVRTIANHCDAAVTVDVGVHYPAAYYWPAMMADTTAA